MKIDQLLLLNQPYKFKTSMAPALFSEEETLIIYIPENGAEGKDFANLLRKKNIFNEFQILPLYKFMNRRIQSTDYIKEFRLLNPNIKIVPEFKTFVKGRVNVIDLTQLTELYNGLSMNLSKIKVTKDYLSLINEFIDGTKKKFPKIKIFMMIEATENLNFIDNLFKIARKNSFKFNKEEIKVDGGFVFLKDEKDENKLYPLLMANNSEKEKTLIFKINVFNNLLKDLKVDSNYSIDTITPEEKKKVIKDEIVKIAGKINNKSDTSSTKNTGEILKNLNKNKEELIDEIYNLTHSVDLEGKTVAEKIKKLFKGETDKKIINQVTFLNNYLNELNRKFNGSLKINENLLKESSDIYFKPENIVKLTDLTGYRKQETEFNEVLDASMKDLFKSVEKDKEANVSLVNVKSEIFDTNSSRFKKYIITFKNNDTENKEVYDQTILVPYPTKGKYLKLNGVNYIMANQFFSKPILKIKPNLVRLYTQYSTFSVTLKTHAINEIDDIEKIFKNLLKEDKRIKINYCDVAKLEDIKSDYDLDIDLMNINKIIEI